MSHLLRGLERKELVADAVEAVGATLQDRGGKDLVLARGPLRVLDEPSWLRRLQGRVKERLFCWREGTHPDECGEQDNSGGKRRRRS